MKPENLLLTADGHIKCIDFGTARFLANDKRTADLYNIKKGEDTLEIGASAQKKNHRSTFVGTAQYVSPEMLEGSDCGAPADLWALGNCESKKITNFSIRMYDIFDDSWSIPFH